jgi:hypothetical protein
VEKFPEKSGNYALAVREMPVGEILASEQHIRGLASYLRRHGVKLGQRDAEVMVYLDLTQESVRKFVQGGGKQERFRRPQGVAATMGRSR